MTPERLDAVYPNIPTAIAYFETIFCGEKQAVEALRECGPRRGFDYCLGVVKRICSDHAAQEPESKLPDARRQMDHPEFVVYLRGKLGMM